MEEMGGACSTHGNLTIAYKLLVGKCDGETPLGRLRLEDSITMDLKGKVWLVVDWIELA
jgi:hypothetical protein